MSFGQQVFLRKTTDKLQDLKGPVTPQRRGLKLVDVRSPRRPVAGELTDMLASLEHACVWRSMLHVFSALGCGFYFVFREGSSFPPRPQHCQDGSLFNSTHLCTVRLTSGQLSSTVILK